MNLKKKITLHLDAVIVIVLLFFLSFAGSAYLLMDLAKLNKQMEKMQIQMLVDDMNLSSQKVYIKKIQNECGIELPENEESTADN
ncbi:hypothetical protein [Neptuniibacter sp.]|uniref:hypothetical protein n=1 Tax=Neptuniibacter sp. TaxID=1962643 RepID=UPI0026061B87|nr:hypothetical protein [Neptuniibacter sp.]MCP4597630.1 hypothetical protein [Neptuniibacter sp.]